MVRSIFGFFKAFFPIIELALPAFVLGNLFGSSATAIVIFICLLVFNYLYSITISIAWAVMIFFYVSAISNLLFGVIAGLLVGGIRYLLRKYLKW
ncbi:hypothetical protein [Thermoflavimicrobium daqui]|uniref:Uncharacterized protein n=1 Tax=Thermoflavimicrobium daqui TaxID=2137476 RepID=A0A364K9Q8_9BACL|nr:hypothetical protein [Thermoflavimicrobium daqui]RAL27031.1 hypothetical protein DL897_03060 [Thermoflavimicrobium daqui]